MAASPRSLWLVRHGESEGNVADALAHRRGAARLEIDANDIQVPLSEAGEKQARAFGRWLAGVDPDERPTLAVLSPYVRAQHTADLILDEAGMADLPRVSDERLRDREQGVLDRFTAVGVRETYPDEAERLSHVGKFWYRPAGGESWADVALRIRSLLLDLRLTRSGERILAVTHDVTILLIRYVLENLSVEEAVALSGQVRNCSLTRYDERDGELALTTFNCLDPLAHEPEAPVTAHE